MKTEIYNVEGIETEIKVGRISKEDTEAERKDGVCF